MRLGGSGALLVLGLLAGLALAQEPAAETAVEIALHGFADASAHIETPLTATPECPVDAPPDAGADWTYLHTALGESKVVLALRGEAEQARVRIWRGANHGWRPLGAYLSDELEYSLPFSHPLHWPGETLRIETTLRSDANDLVGTARLVSHVRWKGAAEIDGVLREVHVTPASLQSDSLRSVTTTLHFDLDANGHIDTGSAREQFEASATRTYGGEAWTLSWRDADPKSPPALHLARADGSDQVDPQLIDDGEARPTRQPREHYPLDALIQAYEEASTRDSAQAQRYALRIARHVDPEGEKWALDQLGRTEMHPFIAAALADSLTASEPVREWAAENVETALRRPELQYRLAKALLRLLVAAAPTEGERVCVGILDAEPAFYPDGGTSPTRLDAVAAALLIQLNATAHGKRVRDMCARTPLPGSPNPYSEVWGGPHLQFMLRALQRHSPKLAAEVRTARAADAHLALAIDAVELGLPTRIERARAHRSALRAKPTPAAVRWLEHRHGNHWYVGGPGYRRLVSALPPAEATEALLYGAGGHPWFHIEPHQEFARLISRSRGAAVEAELERGLRSKNARVQLAAIRAVGRCGARTLESKVLAIAREADSRLIARACVDAVVQLGDEGRVGVLLKGARSGQPWPTESLLAAARLAPDSSKVRGAVRRLLASEETADVVRGLRAIRQSPSSSPDGVPPALLTHEDWRVRRHAVRATAARGGKDAVARLVERLPDEEVRHVRTSMARALASLTDQHLGDNPIAWKAWWEDHEDTFEPIDWTARAPRPARSSTSAGPSGMDWGADDVALIHAGCLTQDRDRGASAGYGNPWHFDSPPAFLFDTLRADIARTPGGTMTRAHRSDLPRPEEWSISADANDPARAELFDFITAARAGHHRVYDSVARRITDTPAQVGVLYLPNPYHFDGRRGFMAEEITAEITEIAESRGIVLHVVCNQDVAGELRSLTTATGGTYRVGTTVRPRYDSR